MKLAELLAESLSEILKTAKRVICGKTTHALTIPVEPEPVHVTVTHRPRDRIACAEAARTSAMQRLDEAI